MRWILAAAVSASLCACATVPRKGSLPRERSAVLDTARSMVGKRYKFGGASPKKGFDCSGLVMWVYERHGIDLPRLSKEQFLRGRRIGRWELAPGDLVFFATDQKGPSHVGIYAGERRFIHAPSKSGKRVREDSLSDPYWGRRFLGGRRLL